MSSVSPEFVSKQGRCRETGPWVDQVTRGGTCRVFCCGVVTHKHDLSLFHVLPGAPAVVVCPASFKLLFSPFPTISQFLLPGKGLCTSHRAVRIIS